MFKDPLLDHPLITANPDGTVDASRMFPCNSFTPEQLAALTPQEINAAVRRDMHYTMGFMYGFLDTVPENYDAYARQPDGRGLYTPWMWDRTASYITGTNDGEEDGRRWARAHWDELILLSDEEMARREQTPEERAEIERVLHGRTGG
ncbi:MAG: hypothetical protein Q4F72_10805 [Desulfovibrionaceae bacterium]|nr:hypothetical protein [Desulfovibrionaceae bacterium]